MKGNSGTEYDFSHDLGLEDIYEALEITNFMVSLLFMALDKIESPANKHGIID